MRNLAIFGLLFGIIGLVIGYLIFGRWGLTNELIPLQDLFSSADNALGRIARDVAGLSSKRQSIYISGGVGVAIGIVLGLLLRRRR